MSSQKPTANDINAGSWCLQDFDYSPCRKEVTCRVAIFRHGNVRLLIWNDLTFGGLCERRLFAPEERK